MARRFVRVDLSGNARDFYATALEPGLPVLDRGGATARCLARWLGRFAAEAEWEGDWVNYYVRDERGNRLADADCAPVTETDLAGPLRHELEEVQRRAGRAVPASADERLRYRCLTDCLLPLLADAGRKDRDCYLFKYTGEQCDLHLVWCCGYERADKKRGRAVICRNPECRRLVARGNLFWERCPTCRGVLPDWRPPWGRIAAAVLLFLILLSGVVAWYARPGAVVEGQVVSAMDHQPIVAARISRDGLPDTVTGNNGQFRLTRLRQGTVELNVSADRHLTQRVTQTLSHRETKTITVALVHDTILYGRVLEAVTGRPVGGAIVSVRGTERKQTTDDSGRFELCQVPAGRVSLTASASGFHSKTVEVQLKAQEETQADLQLSGTEILAGRVVAADSDKPVPGAKLTVVKTPLAAESDDQGQFRIPGIPRGSLTVAASAVGFAGREWTITVPSVEPLRLELAGAAVVTGTVVRAVNRRPIPQATVWVPQWDRRTVTDAQGRFRLQDVPGLATIVRAEAEGFEANQVDADCRPGAEATIEFALTGGATLTGQVLCRLGDCLFPIAGAEIAVEHQDRNGRSDHEGRFCIGDVQAGRVVVMASAEGFEPSKRQGTLPAGVSPPAQIVLTGATTIRGTVTNSADGTPVPDASVVLCFGDVKLTATADSEGRYQHAGIPPGDLTLTASAADFFAGEAARSVPPAEPVVDFHLAPKAVLEVAIRERLGNQPVPDVKLRVSNGAAVMTATSDPQGRCLVSEIPVGRATLELSASGFFTRQIEHSCPQGKSALEIVLDPAMTVSGTVLDNGTQQPIRDARVAVLGTDFQTQTDAQGAYRLNELPAGQARIEASRAGYGSKAVAMDVKPGLKPLSFRLTREATLVVQVVDATSGKPISDAEVDLTWKSDGSDEQKWQSRTPADGGVRFERLRAGAGGVEVRAGDYLPQTSPLSLLGFAPGEERLLRFVLTRRLKAGEVRIVLQWDAVPGDLDAHLVGPAKAEGEPRLHVFFARSQAEKAQLDVDDADGYGPETITLAPAEPGVWYHFLVHDFQSTHAPNTSQLPRSAATVRVYDKDSVWTFVANGQKANALWHVCDFRVTASGAAEVRKIDTFSDRIPDDTLQP